MAGAQVDDTPLPGEDPTPAPTPEPQPEPVAAQPEAAPAPAFDAATLNSAIQQGLSDGLRSIAARVPQQPQQQYAQDPVAAAVAPVVGPAMQSIALRAEAAQDAALFYNTVPGASAFAQDIEAIFNDRLNRGVPAPRADIFNWYRGQHFDKFYEVETAKRAEKVSAARNAQAVGGGLSPQGQPTQVKNARDASMKELEDYMRGGGQGPLTF